MLVITNPATGLQLEVSSGYNVEQMTWSEANQNLVSYNDDSVNHLGSGWRLPTLAELELMHKQISVDSEGNLRSPFVDGFYWSSDEMDQNSQVTVNLREGNTFGNNYFNDTAWVQFVRPL